jgi:hypothetical protein
MQSGLLEIGGSPTDRGNICSSKKSTGMVFSYANDIYAKYNENNLGATILIYRPSRYPSQRYPVTVAVNNYLSDQCFYNYYS